MKLELDDWDRLGREFPASSTCSRPGKFLMEDFYYAGGLPAVMREMGDLIHRDALTVNGKTIGENIAGRAVLESRGHPDRSRTAQGRKPASRCCAAISLPTARSSSLRPPHPLCKHRGRAVVFENIEDFKARIDDPDLDIDETCVMVLKNCGPEGYPGMAEVGNMPLPPKLLKQGRHRHGAHLRCAHERHRVRHRGAARRRPRRLPADRCAGEDRRHRSSWTSRRGGCTSMCATRSSRIAGASGQRLRQPRCAATTSSIIDHVMQADRGADLDFLVGASGADVPRESH